MFSKEGQIKPRKGQFRESTLKKCAVVVVLVFLAVSMASAALAFEPIFLIGLTNDFGGFEGQAIAQLDPPGYPDGRGDEQYGWGDEPFSSHVTLIGTDGGRYSNLTHSVLESGEVWMISGLIWSGVDNRQSAVNVDWWVDYSFIPDHRWDLQIFSPSGELLVQINPVIDEMMGYDGGSFTLPILPVENWQDGYAFDLLVFNPAPVPEPSSLLAVGIGLVGFAGFCLRRRR